MEAEQRAQALAAESAARRKSEEELAAEVEKYKGVASQLFRERDRLKEMERKLQDETDAREQAIARADNEARLRRELDAEMAPLRARAAALEEKEGWSEEAEDAAPGGDSASPVLAAWTSGATAAQAAQARVRPQSASLHRADRSSSAAATASERRKTSRPASAPPRSAPSASKEQSLLVTKTERARGTRLYLLGAITKPPRIVAATDGLARECKTELPLWEPNCVAAAGTQLTNAVANSPA